MLEAFVCPIPDPSASLKTTSPRAGTESECLIFPPGYRRPPQDGAWGRGAPWALEGRGGMLTGRRADLGRQGGRGHPLPRRAPPTACAAHPGGGIPGGRPRPPAPSSGGPRWVGVPATQVATCRASPAAQESAGSGRVGRPTRARGAGRGGASAAPSPGPGLRLCAVAAAAEVARGPR